MKKILFAFAILLAACTKKSDVTPQKATNQQVWQDSRNGSYTLISESITDPIYNGTSLQTITITFNTDTAALSELNTQLPYPNIAYFHGNIGYINGDNMNAEWDFCGGTIIFDVKILNVKYRFTDWRTGQHEIEFTDVYQKN